MTAFVILPVIISRPEHRVNNDNGAGYVKSDRQRCWEIKMHVATLWAISNAIFACSMAATWFVTTYLYAEVFTD
jgi:hypothetical protein